MRPGTPGASRGPRRSVTCVVRSACRLVSCARSPMPVRPGVYTSCPVSRRGPRTQRVTIRCVARTQHPSRSAGGTDLGAAVLTGVRSARTAGHGTSWRIRTATSSASWPRPGPTGRGHGTAGPFHDPRQLAVTALRWPVPRGWRPRRPAGPSRSRSARTGFPHRRVRRLPPAIGQRSRVHHACPRAFRGRASC